MPAIHPGPWHRLLCAVLLFTLGFRPALALISMEQLHLQKPPEGFSGELDLSAVGSNGNTNKSGVLLGTRLQWQNGLHTSFLVLDYAYGQSNDVIDTDRRFVHARHIYQARERVAGEVFLQEEQNRFARIASRRLAGGGARLALLERRENSAAFLGAGGFHEWETVSEAAGTTDTGDTRTWRANLYLVLKYQLNEMVRFVSSTYYQPALDDPADYRAYENAVMQISITDRLGLRTSIEVRYDSRPPQTIEATDTIYHTGINYEF